jgi:hypothetical protein
MISQLGHSQTRTPSSLSVRFPERMFSLWQHVYAKGMVCKRAERAWRS